MYKKNAKLTRKKDVKNYGVVSQNLEISFRHILENLSKKRIKKK